MRYFCPFLSNLWLQKTIIGVKNKIWIPKFGIFEIQHQLRYRNPAQPELFKSRNSMIEFKWPAISMLETECLDDSCKMWLKDIAVFVTNILIYSNDMAFVVVDQASGIQSRSLRTETRKACGGLIKRAYLWEVNISSKRLTKARIGLPEWGLVWTTCNDSKIESFTTIKQKNFRKKFGQKSEK